MAKKFLALTFCLVGFSLIEATPAAAVVCAGGPVRAGCVSRYGAVGVRRPYVRRGVAVVRRPYRPGVVVRRTTVVR